LADDERDQGGRGDPQQGLGLGCRPSDSGGARERVGKRTGRERERGNAQHIDARSLPALLCRKRPKTERHGSGWNEWGAFDDPLDPEQTEELAAHRDPRPEGVITNQVPGPDAARLTPADAALASALHEDGRASYAQLAAATGWSKGQVARRLGALLASGALYVDVEIATELLGFSAPALLWITVPPSELTAAAERIAATRESAFVAAVSGPANLHATVACRDPHHLHEFLVGEIGALKAVHTVETSLMARRVKQAGSIMMGPRLPRPA